MKKEDIEIFLEKIIEKIDKLLKERNKELIEFFEKKFSVKINSSDEKADKTFTEIRNEQKKLLEEVSSVGKQLEKVVEEKSEKEVQLLIDELTGVRNRLGFKKKFEEELFLSKKYKHPLSIVMIDIDNFKKINDTFGHQAGDKVLCDLTKFIKMNIRSIDFLARWGGEEFVLVLPETPPAAAFNLADRIKDLVAKKTFIYKKNMMNITISGGVASYPGDGYTEKTLIAKADEKLLEAKQKGKNKIVI